jgi:F-type H+-transporting ATPase subunit a
VAVVGSISVFVLCSNLFSVIPVFSSPTGHPSVPLACALITFLFFNYQGMRAHGVLGYLKHFAGDTWWLSPLIFPVEIISTTARVLSLTVRLWANMFSSELLYFIFLGLLMAPSTHFMHDNPVLGWVLAIFPATLPVAFIGLHIFVAVIQAFVFTILPSIYLGMATAHEH